MPTSDELDPMWGASEQRRRVTDQEQVERKADQRDTSARGSTQAQEPRGTEGQRRGGMTTKRRYGHEHFVEIGAKGGEIVRDKRGKDFYVEIGRRGGKSPKHRHPRDEENGPALPGKHESNSQSPEQPL
jgi:general stress protein YciG